MFGDSYSGYIVWSFLYSVQCMETHIEGTIYGYSYTGYESMDSHIEGTMYGDSYRGYNVWRLI